MSPIIIPYPHCKNPQSYASLSSWYLSLHTRSVEYFPQQHGLLFTTEFPRVGSDKGPQNVVRASVGTILIAVLSETCARSQQYMMQLPHEENYNFNCSTKEL